MNLPLLLPTYGNKEFNVYVIYQHLIGHLRQGAGLLLAEVGDELLVLGLITVLGLGLGPASL